MKTRSSGGYIAYSYSRLPATCMVVSMLDAPCCIANQVIALLTAQQLKLRAHPSSGNARVLRAARCKCKYYAQRAVYPRRSPGGPLPQKTQTQKAPLTKNVLRGARKSKPTPTHKNKNPKNLPLLASLTKKTPSPPALLAVSHQKTLWLRQSGARPRLRRALIKAL